MRSKFAPLAGSRRHPRLPREAIASLTGLPPIVPGSPDRYTQMATVPPLCDPGALERRRYEEHRVELPVLVRHDRCYLRLPAIGPAWQARHHPSQSSVPALLLSRAGLAQPVLYRRSTWPARLGAMVPRPRAPRRWAGSGEGGHHPTRTPAVRAITVTAEAPTQAGRPGAV